MNRMNENPFGKFSFKDLLNNYPPITETTSTIKPKKEKKSDDSVISARELKELKEEARGFTATETSIAEEIVYNLNEFGKLQSRIELIGDVIEMTINREDGMSSNNMNNLFVSNESIPEHPLFTERFQAAKMLESDIPHDDLVKSVLDNFNVESIILGSRARKHMKKVQELMSLF